MGYFGRLLHLSCLRALMPLLLLVVPRGRSLMLALGSSYKRDSRLGEFAMHVRCMLIHSS